MHNENLPASPDDDDLPPDADTLRRLRWRCRRGLLENDIFIDRFFVQNEAHLTRGLVRGLLELMDLPDNELLDLLLSRTQLQGDLDSDQVRRVLSLMQSAPLANAGA